MNDIVNSKLILLLRYKIKKNQIGKDDKSIDEFIRQIVSGKVSEELINYLYNYLFQNDSNRINNLKYSNNRIVLEELVDSIYKKIIKYSIIDSGEKISDIKRTSVIVKHGNNKKTTVQKSIHYALDCAIDLMILETPEYAVSNSGGYDSTADNIINDKNYSKISYILSDDETFKSYETIGLNNGKYNRCKKVLVKDELVDYNPENVRVASVYNNLSEETKKSTKHLKMLYEFEREHHLNKNNKPLNGDENLYDPDLYEFFEKMKDNVNGEYGASR